MSGSKRKGDARVLPSGKAPPTRLGRLLHEVRRRSPDVYALLGMKGEAIEALRRVDHGDYNGPRYEYLNLAFDAHLNPLRGDPRFRAILAERKAEYDERVKEYGNL
jgi:hypothetical protein